MNVAAFVFAMLGAGLSLFQPVITIPIVDVSINLFAFLSYPGLDFGDRLFGFFVLIIAAVGVICGINILKGNLSDACLGGIFLCFCTWVGLFLLSLLFAPVTHWVYLLWALCYLIAIVCVSGANA